MRQAASSQQASWQAACAQPSRSCAGCGSSNGSGRIQIHTHTHKQADKAYIHTGNKQHREQRHTHTHALRETKSFIFKHIYRISWQYRDKLGSSTQTLVIETCQLPPPPPISLTHSHRRFYRPMHFHKLCPELSALCHISAGHNCLETVSMSRAGTVVAGLVSPLSPVPLCFRCPSICKRIFQRIPSSICCKQSIK